MFSGITNRAQVFDNNSQILSINTDVDLKIQFTSFLSHYNKFIQKSDNQRGVKMSSNYIKSDKCLDDKPLWNVIAGLVGYHAVTVAHSLGLFSILEEEALSIEDVSKKLKIELRPTEALIFLNVNLGFLNIIGNKISISELTEKYLLKSSETYFGSLFDLAINNPLTHEKLKEAVITNRPQIYGGKDIFDSHEDQNELAKHFTEAMHSISVAPASGWVEKVNLKNHQIFLDIGGGSGAHTIKVLLRWKHLNGVVLDIAPVCEVAQKMLDSSHVSSRANTFIGDFWECDFPAADIHFYSQIFHDWPEDKCKFLAKKSFNSMESGGKILIHETLFDDDKLGPFVAAAGSIAMLSWTEGKHYSGSELSKMLSEIGYRNIQVIPTFGYWSLVVGEK